MVEIEDPVPINQRMGFSFNSALLLRSLKVAKRWLGGKGVAPINKNCTNSLNSSIASRNTREGSIRVGEVKPEF